MEAQISASIIKEKSFDPNFQVKVSYDDGKTRFKNEIVFVSRKPPKVSIDYPESVLKVRDKIDIKKIELEIMRAIVDTLLTGKRL